VTLKFYNTLTKRVEEFVPLHAGEARVYVCGPTVYNYAHVGNFRTYVFSDLLRRWLKHKGFKVTQVMNLTDVDDKTIRGSREQGIPLKQFTKFYEKAFFEDCDALGIQRVEHYPRATEHVQEMITLVKKLFEKGFAYKGEDGSVYYNINKFKDYGKLSGTSLKDLKTGASGRVRSDEYSKENASDFVLWKAWTPEDGNVYWQTELGKGRPGWHLECSAMSMKYLSESFDIHAGGVDLIFPHHENEIAQSEGATGKKFVNYWLHCEHLLVNGRKMSKSLGNFYTLRDLLEKNFKPKTIRYFLLSGYYKQQLNLTFEALHAAEESVKRLNDFRDSLEQIANKKSTKKNQTTTTSETTSKTASKSTSDTSSQTRSETTSEPASKLADELTAKAKNDFEKALDSDLNTPLALAALFDFVREFNKLAEEKKISATQARNALQALEEFDSILGVLSRKKPSPELEKFVEEKIREREAARKRRDFATSDAIRLELKRRGVVIEDTPNGVKWKLEE